MERVRIHTLADAGAAASKAADVLRAGGIILFPTDTIYGLGADALSDEAVQKIYRIKGRDEGKPVHALVSDMNMALRYADMSEELRAKIETCIPCPVTFICKKNTGTETGIAKGMETFGFRVPDNVFCLELAKQFGGPVTATSANKSGEAPRQTVEEILEQLGDTSLIDLVIDGGVLPPSSPSTVVDVSSGEPRVLREGAVSATDIAKMLR